MTWIEGKWQPALYVYTSLRLIMSRNGRVCTRSLSLSHLRRSFHSLPSSWLIDPLPAASWLYYQTEYSRRRYASTRPSPSIDEYNILQSDLWMLDTKREREKKSWKKERKRAAFSIILFLFFPFIEQMYGEECLPEGHYQLAALASLRIRPAVYRFRASPARSHPHRSNGRRKYLLFICAEETKLIGRKIWCSAVYTSIYEAPS